MLNWITAIVHFETCTTKHICSVSVCVTGTNMKRKKKWQHIPSNQGNPTGSAYHQALRLALRYSSATLQPAWYWSPVALDIWLFRHSGPHHWAWILQISRVYLKLNNLALDWLLRLKTTNFFNSSQGCLTQAVAARWPETIMWSLKFVLRIDWIFCSSWPCGGLLLLIVLILVSIQGANAPTVEYGNAENLKIAFIRPLDLCSLSAYGTGMGFCYFKQRLPQAVPVGDSSCELIFIIGTASADNITSGQLHQQERLYGLGWVASLTWTLVRCFFGIWDGQHHSGRVSCNQWRVTSLGLAARAVISGTYTKVFGQWDWVISC